MRFFHGLLIVLGCGVGAISAAEPAGKVIRESWDAAFLDGEKSGHFHTTIRELTRGGQTIITTTRELELSVRRQGQIATIKAQTGDEESPDGKLLGVWMTQMLGTNVQVKLSGRVVGGMLKDTLEGSSVPGNKVEREIKIPDDTLTFSGEETLLKTRKAKPGDRLSYRLFEPFANTVVRVEVAVKDWEKVPLNGVIRVLLRVEAKPEKIEGVQLPSQTLWYDEDYNLVLSQGEIPGLGELTLRRTTEREAKAPLGKLRDLGDLSIVLDKPIADAHRTRKVVYRVNFAKDMEDTANIFSVGDDRQEIQNATERSLELHVTAVRIPPKKPSNELISKEYLASNFFITSDDELVRKHAKAAVGTENDPWLKSKAIERWVKQNMKPMVFTEAMAPADHVARTLTGDCTEFAMLAAAMCRAQGIPSRTAIGAVYYLDRGQAKLGYHMWTEVLVRGQWLAIDATLGYGSVGPAHVKITDASWHDVRSMLPLMPVMRVMSGKPRMEVLRVERD
jgi:hypothetical protein